MRIGYVGPTPSINSHLISLLIVNIRVVCISLKFREL